MRRTALSLILVGLAAVAGAGVSQAGDRVPYGGANRYGGAYPGYGYGEGGYGFADAAIGGAYIGAPLTRFPRPSELVAPGLSYGTYGVPTVPGIRQAPSGQPTVYVVDPGIGRSARRGRSVETIEGDERTGARIISLHTR